jgi:conjugal transfer ATP-binding protein TraC
MMTIHYPDQVKKIGDVRRRFTMINHQAYGTMSRMIPVIAFKKAGFDVLMNDIEGSGAVLVETNLTMAVFSKESDKLEKQVAGLTAYYMSLGFDMREDKRILRPLWDAILPLNTSRKAITNLFRFQTMATTHAVQFLPVFGDWNGTGSGAASVFVTRRGEVALFDLYDSTTNFNAVIMAEAGSGKSFVTQQLITDYLATGAKVWAIDLGRSYYKLNRAVGGEFIAFSDTSQICLNPFTNVDDIDEEMVILKAMLTKMAAPEEGLDDYRMAIMEEAIKSVWSHYGNAMTVTEVAEWCTAQEDPRVRDIGRQLFPFTRLGSYGHWFNGENNLDFSRDFVLLELEELKSKRILLQVVLLQIVAKINHDMYLTQGRKKILIIDEAWDLLDDPIMAKAMESAYRRARKYDGAVVIVTQSIADLFTSPNARAIYQNSAYQLVLQQRSEAIDAAVESRQFNIDAYGVSVMKSVHTLPGRYSEILIKRSENDWGVIRLVVDRFSQVLFSTKGEERSLIFDAIDRGEDVLTAIKEYIKATENSLN